MNFSRTKISWRRPLTSYSKIRALVAAIRRNRRFFVPTKKLPNKRYLNIGCGPNGHGQFVNLDYDWLPNVDVCWDATTPLPFPESRFVGVYSEHCLEHLSIDDADRLFAEIFRILEPTGHLRIVVPDGELYLTGYTDLTRKLSVDPLPYSESDSFRDQYSPILSINRIFREHGHQFIYDFATQEMLLKKHGFVDIKKETFGNGTHSALLIDSKSRAVESLYVEARKP